jgi:hypothetical protein
MIQFVLEAFNDLFEAVAIGTLTFLEVVEEAQQLLKINRENTAV